MKIVTHAPTTSIFAHLNGQTITPEAITKHGFIIPNFAVSLPLTFATIVDIKEEYKRAVADYINTGSMEYIAVRMYVDINRVYV